MASKASYLGRGVRSGGLRVFSGVTYGIWDIVASFSQSAPRMTNPMLWRRLIDIPKMVLKRDEIASFPDELGRQAG